MDIFLHYLVLWFSIYSVLWISVYGPSLPSAIKLSQNSLKYLMPILGDIEWYGHGPAAKAGNCTRHDCTKKSNITGLAIHEHFMSETKLRN